MSGTMTKWAGSENAGNATGTATFSVGGVVLAIRLECFADAHALGNLIAAAEGLAADRARRSCAAYMRGAVAHMETGA